MKVKILLALVLCALSFNLKAQENKIEIQKNQILVSPKEFPTTLGLVFNFDSEFNLKVLIKNEKEKVVFTKDFDKVQNASYKLNLSSLENGFYYLIIISDEKTVFKEKIKKSL